MIEVIEHAGVRYAEVLRSPVRAAESAYFSPASSALQFGVIARPKGFCEPPHTHTERERVIRDVQQFFIVLEGRVAIDFFSTGGERVKEVELRPGDSILLIEGAHALRVLEDAQCVTVKQGPFLGDDKVEVRRP